MHVKRGVRAWHACLACVRGVNGVVHGLRACVRTCGVCVSGVQACVCVSPSSLNLAPLQPSNLHARRTSCKYARTVRQLMHNILLFCGTQCSAASSWRQARTKIFRTTDEADTAHVVSESPTTRKPRLYLFSRLRSNRHITCI